MITAFIGIPLLVLRWWWLKRAKRNITTIEETYATYLARVAYAAEPAAAPMMRAM